MSYNSAYKKWHKPNMREDARTHQGYYKIQNREKYIGDPNLCIYRSSWEYGFSKWCDYSPSVKRWSSEPMKVPYYDRVSKLDECKKLGLDPNNPKNWVVKNYNLDFWCEIDKGEGIVEKWFVEIKPKDQLKKPVPPSNTAPLKEIKKFNLKAKEYLLNEAKFAALNEWAQKSGAKFYIFTEDSLQKIIGRFWYELPNNNT
jgi:hypothetical protein